MNNIEILEEFIKQYNTKYPQEIKIIKILMQENKKLLTKLQEHKCIETVFKPLYIPKSKLKEIIYPTPENPISFEVQSSEMYKKLEKLVERRII